MARKKLILDEALTDALIEYCERTLILPDDLIRTAIHQPQKEPFLIDTRNLAGRDHTERTLRILFALWKAAPESFEQAAARPVKGSKRLWLARDRKAIEDSGANNKCQRIGESPWFLSTNCDPDGMKSRVGKVMRGMGFSWAYVRLVQHWITDMKGRVCQHLFFD